MEHWTQERYDAFRRELYAQQEEAYRQFHTGLLRSDLPVIGLRAPLLRKIAAEIAKEDGVGFLRICGRGTYEERLLYGLVAAALPVSYAEFLPYCDTYTETIVENWAHCDSFCASLKKRIKGHEAEFFRAYQKVSDLRKSVGGARRSDSDAQLLSHPCISSGGAGADRCRPIRAVLCPHGTGVAAGNGLGEGQGHLQGVSFSSSSGCLGIP